MNYKKYIGLNEDIIKIRTSVFVEEQGFKNEFDEIDKICSHIVFYDKDQPICTCRYFLKDGNYHIGRISVIKEYRGQYLGKKIMQVAEDEIKKNGGQVIEISAQIRVQNFYTKLGYNPIGKVYLDEFCEHIKMIKNI